MVKSSSAITIGVVEEELLVIRPDKVSGARTLPNGQVQRELPNPSEYMAGKLYRLRVDEVVKGDRRIRKGQVIDIFVPGRGSTHDPALMKGQRFMVFLSRLKEDNKEYESATVVNPGNISAAGRRFNSKMSYELVSGSEGIIAVTPETRRLINDVKAAARNRRRV